MKGLFWFLKPQTIDGKKILIDAGDDSLENGNNGLFRYLMGRGVLNMIMHLFWCNKNLCYHIVLKIGTMDGSDN